jgi:serine protease Do
MSSRVATRVIAQLQEFGETRRGWLGVRIQDVSADVAEAIGLETAAGALVTDVPEGPAMEAGMESGDVILTFDGADIADTRELVNRVANTEVGKEVRVVVFRDGGTQTLRVTLGRREEAERAVPASAPANEPTESEILGLTVATMTDELREQLGLASGAEGLVVRDVDAESEAYRKGLRAGDVITEAGQQAVTSPNDLQARIDEAVDAGRKSLLLLVRREGEPRFVAITLDQG